MAQVYVMLTSEVADYCDYKIRNATNQKLKISYIQQRFNQVPAEIDVFIDSGKEYILKHWRHPNPLRQIEVHFDGNHYIQEFPSSTNEQEKEIKVKMTRTLKKLDKNRILYCRRRMELNSKCIDFHFKTKKQEDILLDRELK